MQPIDNSQYTEEQRTEAYRIESLNEARRQTALLQTIRSIMTFFAVVLVLAIIGWIVLAAASASGGL